jgi:starch phosphorylase
MAGRTCGVRACGSAFKWAACASCLLDTNVPENNTPADREITHRLYGGDKAVRIRQEMVLGIGGVRALRALGLAPAVWHINEGHAAFLIARALRELRRTQGASCGGRASRRSPAQCAFTTHTPVAAGHDSVRRTS